MIEREGLLCLDGIDGSNPLGFLAALGTLMTLDRSNALECIRLGWRSRAGAWRPVLEIRPEKSRNELVQLLVDLLVGRADRPEFDLGHGEDDLSVAPSIYRAFALEAASRATPADRTMADFAASFASEIHLDPQGRVRDTALRTMSGSGNQHFLAFMRVIIEATESEHVDEALFEEWRYEDPLRGLSLRWEPTETRRHAYQWVNPSKDPAREKRGGMLGANRLAIEALPLLPTFPRERVVVTTGFRTLDGRVTWVWPIWLVPLPVRVVRSVLALREIRDERRRDQLRLRGIVGLFRSTRVSDGYFRNFTVGVPGLLCGDEPLGWDG